MQYDLLHYPLHAAIWREGGNAMNRTGQCEVVSIVGVGVAFCSRAAAKRGTLSKLRKLSDLGRLPPEVGAKFGQCSAKPSTDLAHPPRLDLVVRGPLSSLKILS